jgi:hypothetical protein
VRYLGEVIGAAATSDRPPFGRHYALACQTPVLSRDRSITSVTETLDVIVDKGGRIKPRTVRQRSTAAASDDVVKPRNLMLSIGGHCSADFTGGPRRWTRHVCAPGAIRTTMRSGRSC